MKPNSRPVYKVAKVDMRRVSKEQLLRVHSQLCSLSHSENAVLSW